MAYLSPTAGETARVTKTNPVFALVGQAVSPAVFLGDVHPEFQS
jgi:hypothetical protein